VEVRTLGIVLAKNVFRLHGVDAKGRSVLTRQLRRRQVLPFLAQLGPCLVGLEACGGAHYFAREMGERGHEVKLMSPRFVRPSVKSNKNDARRRGDLRSRATALDAVCSGQRAKLSRTFSRCIGCVPS
jgi:transposase